MFAINYEALFELSTDAMIVVNQAGHIVKANEAFYTLSQFEFDDFQNRSYATFFEGVHSQGELTASDQCAQFICKDGLLVPILVRKVDGAGFFFVVMKDMRAFDEVAERQPHYRMIAENIQDVLILMDEHKNYLYVSPSAQQMFEFDYLNIGDRNAFFNIHPDYVDELNMCFEKGVVEGVSFSLKVKAWHEEHQWIWTELNGQPMYEDGKFQHMLLVARDISSQQKYEEGLLRDAYSDTLTNLPNRRKLNELLVEVKSTLKQQHYFAVMLMDIDNFKHINDYYGHEIGDYVLVEFSRRVSAILEGAGIVGRYGGDEFIVLLPYKTQQEVAHLAQQIVSDIQQPIEIQQTTLFITTSIGVALVEDDVAIRNMLKCADDALYQVKGNGKNEFHIVNASEGIGV